MESVEDKFEEIVEFENEDGEIESEVRNRRPFVVTPMGVIPDDWNFWIGHTDFKITRDLADIIMKTSGVESFEVGSPYRFRVAIGLAFESKAVKLEIQSRLGIEKKGLEPEIASKVDEIVKTFKSPYWAIYMTKDGKPEYAESSNLEEIYNKIDLYESTQELAGGYVLNWKTYPVK